ncbi:hypothetical protein LX36DRAFT_38348 [Colletotrichum falcatum]|nr:hypothetical protein LX36DRAFT_38348 [Colletotrichum falcatum]
MGPLAYCFVIFDFPSAGYVGQSVAFPLHGISLELYSFPPHSEKTLAKEARSPRPPVVQTRKSQGISHACCERYLGPPQPQPRTPSALSTCSHTDSQDQDTDPTSPSSKACHRCFLE